MRLIALVLTGMMLVATGALWVGHALTRPALLPSAPSVRSLTNGASIVGGGGGR